MLVLPCLTSSLLPIEGNINWARGDVSSFFLVGGEEEEDFRTDVGR